MDHLNLQLASYELGTEAFAAFRSRQLQTPKALIFDPTHSQVDMREDVEEDELGKSSNSFLVDLHLVRLLVLILYSLTRMTKIVNFLG